MDKVTTKSLGREKRLLKRREFLLVQRYGARSVGKFVIAVGHQNRSSSSGKFGITVPKKVGRAHVRNKIKRRIRHIMRLNQSLFLDKSLVIIASESANTASFSEISRDLLFVCQKFKPNRLFRTRPSN